MSRSNWIKFAKIIGCLVSAVLLGLFLQPEKPKICLHGSNETITREYSAGASSYKPVSFDRSTGWKGFTKTNSSENAKKEHAKPTPELIESRRSADAAEASAVLSYEQARIAAWSGVMTFLTLFAAAWAAHYAGEAAKWAENEFNLSNSRANIDPVTAIGEMRSAGTAIAVSIVIHNTSNKWMQIEGFRTWLGVRAGNINNRIIIPPDKSDSYNINSVIYKNLFIDNKFLLNVDLFFEGRIVSRSFVVTYDPGAPLELSYTDHRD